MTADEMSEVYRQASKAGVRAAEAARRMREDLARMPGVPLSRMVAELPPAPRPSRRQKLAAARFVRAVRRG